MNARAISADDYTQLESAGGYLKQYGRNVSSWIEKGYVDPEDCYIFDNNGAVTGGVCFSADTPEELQILDFALADTEMQNGAQLLKQAIDPAMHPEAKSIGYNLYNDTEQYQDILNLFLQSGFIVKQTKKSYTYENPEPPHRHGTLTYHTIGDAGDEAFIKAIMEVTAGTLDKLMAEDAARLGGENAAKEYFDNIKIYDFNPDWWRLGYLNDELIGLIVPQKFDDTAGGINYVGVLPQHRGNGYGAMLIAEGTYILHKSGIRKVIADIDAGNYPMAAALELAGYVFKMDESVLHYYTRC